MITPEDIPDIDDLYRRIPKVWYVARENRIASGAFAEEDTSVQWEKHVKVDAIVKEHPSVSVAAIAASVPRAENLSVIHTPTKKDDSHSSIKGKKSYACRKKLANSSRLVHRNIWANP